MALFHASYYRKYRVIASVSNRLRVVQEALIKTIALAALIAALTLAGAAQAAGGAEKPKYIFLFIGYKKRGRQSLSLVDHNHISIPCDNLLFRI